MIFGINPLKEALLARPGQIQSVYVRSASHGEIRKIRATCEKEGINTVEKSAEWFDEQFKGRNHQGAAASMMDFSYSSLSDILESWRQSNQKAFILVLDSIQDPQNLGAIIRSAEAAGANGVIIPKHRAAGVSASVSRASAGAVEHVKVAMVTNIAQTLLALKKEGVWVAAADASGKDALYDTDLNMDLAIVIGSEGKGVAALIKKKCDFLLSIPMFGKINSLNASVSAALIMYELIRQRSA